ncbi:GNAT family N-acetyltransferase [Actinomyces bowdenii]|uniref:GNAT family N-acetyltransferase n=1 Tax=Actinomyces bowdenii TaxID=131109 RepID=A0A3P1V643_9ACTO|nr:GNAT family N-acetyltransferase [Actinomyces bowdenii]RRD29662.1 GNAT family N-acetyltransferase [Actinomyces bowdenii]
MSIETCLEHTAPRREELVDLYDSVGWHPYTEHPERLEAAVRASLWLGALREAGTGRLLGLARVVGDDVSIAWLQDLLVRPEAQRQGLGGLLLRAALERFSHVRQFQLLTDADEGTEAFYRSVGLVSAQQEGTVCFMRPLPPPPAPRA